VFEFDSNIIIGCVSLDVVVSTLIPR
jgi:hypothetical protein